MVPVILACLIVLTKQISEVQTVQPFSLDLQLACAHPFSLDLQLAWAQPFSLDLQLASSTLSSCAQAFRAKHMIQIPATWPCSLLWRAFANILCFLFPFLLLWFVLQAWSNYFSQVPKMNFYTHASHVNSKLLWNWDGQCFCQPRPLMFLQIHLCITPLVAWLLEETLFILLLVGGTGMDMLLARPTSCGICRHWMQTLCLITFFPAENPGKNLHRRAVFGRLGEFLIRYQSCARLCRGSFLQDLCRFCSFCFRIVYHGNHFF